MFYPYPGTRLFHVCQERGYLPENFLDLPANHRESILNLPSLSRDDIAEFYDRFTTLREESYLNRQSGRISAETERQIVHEVQKLPGGNRLRTPEGAALSARIMARRHAARSRIESQ